MFSFFKERKQQERDITRDELEYAIDAFLKNNEKVSYRVLINDDYTINYTIIKPYLPVTPTNKFLLTRETFELFEYSEENQLLVQEIDAVQRAVDTYIIYHDTFPVEVGDSDRKICSMKILPYLHHELKTDLYISRKNYLVTTKPEKK